ncbi:putative NBD/HSP70 family sugar kinase [Streptomyces sp. SAI-208]|uniref:ROK family transcriptional regulator n=1 Tax=unclassified Streptomyces TaxID=2593676 RepID=UPI0024765214|nr:MULTISPECIES: ROK family transcriptional regulator [unclassified Streptomyces]MDH6565397.1 putative NBD/HSP70 family sugar kinase [Streptomyces sp. SAI-117]MDH6589686.1 putative NBD/HSP70 family sugar kinase [Streptomyces sp. SAI-133]MDH6604961.1 putative NBD/HSP70 family sugar kinase [Streptomyces sp. SAI-208]
MTSTPDDPTLRGETGSGWPQLHPTTQSAYNQILWNGGLSKSEVAKKLGLSRTRMTAIARDLEAAGLIVEGGREQRASTGRPADMLLARTDLFHFLGVHVRAGELVAAGIDLTNKVVWERSQHVDELDPAVIGAQCRTWLAEAKAGGLRVAALAVCGSVERIDGAAEGVGLQAVAPEAVRSEWEKEFGIPVWAEDDIVALTAFEQWPRLADGQDSMALISLGQEIGVGLVADRKIILGAHRRAGRFSHVLVAADGARCALGHRGCLWAESSTISIVKDVVGAQTLDDVIDRAAAGERTAHERLARAARGIGVAAGHILNLLDPDKVILTGDSPAILDSHAKDFEEGMRTVYTAPASPVIEVTVFDFLEWARAAAGLALYRRLAEYDD